VKPTRYIRSWRVMDIMNQSDVEHVSHAGLPALNDRTRNYPWRASYSAVNGALLLYDIAVAKKLYPWTPKIIQCDLLMDAAGKVSLKLSESKNIFVAVGETAIKEVSSDLTLDLPAGKSVVTFAISSEAGDLKAFSVEITGGPAKVVTGM
ncbi:MAG: hypothetical protein WCL71_16810, partial [Deltaproteobacteria bacterium]